MSETQVPGHFPSQRTCAPWRGCALTVSWIVLLLFALRLWGLSRGTWKNTLKRNSGLCDLGEKGAYALSCGYAEYASKLPQLDTEGLWPSPFESASPYPISISFSLSHDGSLAGLELCVNQAGFGCTGTRPPDSTSVPASATGHLTLHPECGLGLKT